MTVYGHVASIRYSSKDFCRVFDLFLDSLDNFWIIVFGDFPEAFVLRLSDLLAITLVPRLIGSLQGCQDEKAAWKIYIDRGDKPFFIVVIGWNKGFIYINIYKGALQKLLSGKSFCQKKTLVERGDTTLPLTGNPQKIF